MILVPNRPPRLNGNNCLYLLSFLFFISACSRKIVPVQPLAGPEPVKMATSKVEEPVKIDMDHSIVLLLPFQLNHLNLKTTKKSDLSKADLAIDYYQGFKLGLDSISAEGHNYNLHVFDTQNQETQIVNLAMAESVKRQDLIVGPVFPEEIKIFSEFSDLSKIIQVSPLAASLPSGLNDSLLLSINNSIDQHAKKIADFISREYQPELVQLTLVNTQRTVDAKFSNHIKRYLNEFSGTKFRLIERPNVIGIENYLSATKNNLIMITSSDRTFLIQAVDKLVKLKDQKYRIELFGHPDWMKAKYLSPSRMQSLNTRITASYFVNYNDQNVKNFIARYRDEFGLEPSEYSFKGFDTAYYFGLLLKKYGKLYPNYVIKEPYSGLHNEFYFVKDVKLGYRNSTLMMLKYQNFELQVVK
ncbi:MAG: amino acid ABC transporter substrate-binding protein [Bacteroidetes bacterium]|nr:amino acid ABC transporter substrate-binding protein [Bacteroidota bacterium]